MTRKFYRNGWRLLKATPVVGVRVNQITGDCAEQLKFPGSAANANCALRTLRRMLHKAEEWKMIGHAPRIKMMKEHGRHLRLDDEAEKRLLAGASASSKSPLPLRVAYFPGALVILTNKWSCGGGGGLFDFLPHRHGDGFYINGRVEPLALLRGLMGSLDDV